MDVVNYDFSKNCQCCLGDIRSVIFLIACNWDLWSVNTKNSLPSKQYINCLITLCTQCSVLGWKRNTFFGQCLTVSNKKNSDCHFPLTYCSKTAPNVVSIASVVIAVDLFCLGWCNIVAVVHFWQWVPVRFGDVIKSLVISTWAETSIRFLCNGKEWILFNLLVIHKFCIILNSDFRTSCFSSLNLLGWELTIHPFVSTLWTTLFLFFRTSLLESYSLLPSFVFLDDLLLLG